MEKIERSVGNDKSEGSDKDWEPLLRMIANTALPHDFLLSDERQQDVADRAPWWNAVDSLP